LHTIVLDPADNQRMYVAISSGGVYRTTDGGRLDRAKSRHPRIVHAQQNPEFGQCVHKSPRTRPSRTPLLAKSLGPSIAPTITPKLERHRNGVPSDFGFAMIVHPRNPDCVYVIPVESDEFRCSCDGRLRVYRTRTARLVEPLMRGLPQKLAYETVLRDCLVADSFDPVGIYLERAAANSSAPAMKAHLGKILDGLPSITACAPLRRRLFGRALQISAAPPPTISPSDKSPSSRSRSQSKKSRSSANHVPQRGVNRAVTFHIPGALREFTLAVDRRIAQSPALSPMPYLLFTRSPGVVIASSPNKARSRHINLFVRRKHPLHRRPRHSPPAQLRNLHSPASAAADQVSIKNPRKS